MNEGRFALVVDRRGAALEAGSHGTLVLTDADGRRERVGMRALGSVVLHGDVKLSTGLIQSLAAHGVALSVLPLRGRAEGVSFTQWPVRQVALRHAQHRAYASAECRLRLARLAVLAKCEAMAEFARVYAPGGEDAPIRAMRAASEATGVPALMGVEGACSERHFQLLRAAYGEDGPFRFAGRSRMPPADAPNALMSLCYTLAQTEAVRLILHVGLDPQVGFLHGIQRARQSLALDLIEAARAGLDAWVLELLARRRVIGPALFAQGEGEPPRLTQEGRADFYPLWFREGILVAQRPMRALLSRLMRGLREFCLFDNEEVLDASAELCG